MAKVSIILLLVVATACHGLPQNYYFNVPNFFYRPVLTFPIGPQTQDKPPTTQQKAPANYNFRYDVSDPKSGNKFGHQEARLGNFTMGSYYVNFPDGRVMEVVYTADATGYHPRIYYK